MQLAAPFLQLAASLSGADIDPQSLVIAGAAEKDSPLPYGLQDVEPWRTAAPAPVGLASAAAPDPNDDGEDEPDPDDDGEDEPVQLELALQDAAPPLDPNDDGEEEPAIEPLAADEPQLQQASQDTGPPPPEPAPEPQPIDDVDIEPVDEGVSADDPLLDGRRRPGVPRELPPEVTQDNIGAVRAPPPEAFPTDHIPIPDRWRIIETLGVVKERWWDPYNQNTYKGDRPICIPTDEEQEKRKAEGRPKCRTPKWLGLQADDWFFVVSAVSDTVVEPRTFPIPVGIQYPERPGSNDVFGKNNSLVAAQTFIGSLALIKGSTAYKPPDWEYRVTLALQGNYVNVPEKRVLFIEPSKKSDRWDHFLGVQELFVDYHIKNTSDRYDFYSVRVGIQPFNFDFRGFLFQDSQLGVRLFGNRDNNRIQYNLAALWRVEKDTNSGLNDLTQMPRNDWIFHGNIYRQDFPVVGLTSEVSVTYNMNREAGEVEVDDNGFPVVPALIGNLRSRDYDIVYLGYGVDGRIGRLNLSAQAYAALGSDRDNIFTGEKAQVRSFFFAAEPSYDFNWVRLRGAALFATGDGDAFDNTENGFDAIFENPIFAGADTSYWIRQTIPFIGGGRAVNINSRNGILNNLRSSKEEGQSNFNNPGTMLLGVGADFDLTPQWRLSANVNHLWFHKTNIIKTLRSEGSIPNSIGWDVSAAAIYRPKFTQNLVFRASAAVLQPSAGFKDLFENFDRDKRYYSILLNAILTY